MNIVDAGIVLLAVVAALNGFRRGALLQLMHYTGLLIGLGLGVLAAPAVAGLVESPLSQAAVALLVPVALAWAGHKVGWLVGNPLRAVTRRTPLGPLDSIGGSLVAVIVAALVVWFVGVNLANGPFPAVSRAVRASSVMRVLEGALPRPPPALAQARRFLDRFGFPEVFIELPPPAAGPVKGPTTGEVAAAARRASRSTVQIVGAACGGVHGGSGFIAAPHYVVTNAHVVAGMSAPTVRAQNGSRHRARTVLFDPGLDLAVLRSSSITGPVLPLDKKERSRGSTGAVLGYPRGEDLAIGRAAVRRKLEAVGRDIYGRAAVSRDIYELQAVVRPGDSGGPFVSRNGVAAGVIFAASTTDPGVGYALVSTTVLPILDEAVGRTRGVSTNGCAR